LRVGSCESGVGRLPGQLARQRFDLQAVDGDDTEAFVHQVVRERVAGRAQSDDQHVARVVRERIGPPNVERIPACEQAVDLDAPRHPQDVGEHAGFNLRDIDRLLLLVDARFHAVVADAMAGTGAHRVVDDHEGQRSDRVAGLAHHVHLGDLLVERAARQRDAERVRGNRARLVAQPLRAGVLVALVAEHAVVDLADDLACVPARIRELETITPPQAVVGTTHRLRELGPRPLHLDEVEVVDRLRKAEDDPWPVSGIVQARGAPALHRLDIGGHLRLLLLRAGRAGGGLAIEQRATGRGDCQLVIEMRVLLRQADDHGDVGRIERHVLAAPHQRQRTLADEIDLEPEQRVELIGVCADAVRGGIDAEQTREKAADVRRHPHDQIRALDRRGDAVGRGAIDVPDAPQIGIVGRDLRAEPIVQIAQAQRLIQVGVGKPGDAERHRLGGLIHLTLEVTGL
jgi:hypothetical protein